MNCISCNNEIPEGRLKALPGTKVCTSCSDTSKVGGVTIISGKNDYSAVQIVTPEVAQEFNAKQRRIGLVSAGVLMRGKTSVMTVNDKKLEQ